MRRNVLATITTVLILFITVTILTIITKPATSVRADSVSLGNWAWSSNIGWVDLAPNNTPVVVGSVSGDITGYAWSSNIGWIKFGGLSGYPSNGASGVPANIDSTTGEVRGWARACAGTANGDCSSMVSRTDGWDGWIELAGANHPSTAGGSSGVHMDDVIVGGASTKMLRGYAWGGNVIGWLQFNPDYSSLPLTPNPVSTPTLSTVMTVDYQIGLRSLRRTFIVSVSGGTAVGPITYQFKCKETDSSWSTPITTTDTFKVYADCDYSGLDIGNYTASAKVVREGVTSTPTKEITTTDSLLNLWIGGTGNSANKNSYTVKKGYTFGLKWGNALNPKFNQNTGKGYQCNTLIPTASGSNWSSVWDGNVNSDGRTFSPMNTTDTGTYVFKILCENKGGSPDDTQTASAVLEVISSSGGGGER